MLGDPRKRAPGVIRVTRDLWRILYGAISFLLFAALSKGQGLAGLGFSGNEVAVFSLDPTTGVSTLVRTTGADSFNSYAFDPVRRRLYFYDQIPSPDLYTVDLANGTVSHVTVPTCCLALFSDPRTSTLYGLGFSGNEVAVFSLDPTTGVSTPVRTTGADSFNSYAFDPVQRRLYFYDQIPSPDLYTVDLANGTVSHVAVPTCCLALFFAAPSALAIPTLSVAGLVTLALVLALVGFRSSDAFWRF
jgi:hypothetical protein